MTTASTPAAPLGGSQVRKALARYETTSRKLDDAYAAFDDAPDATTADRLEREAEKAAQPYLRTRARLFKLILAANGHDPAMLDDEDCRPIPACGVRVDGRLFLLSPNKPGEWALNAEFAGLEAVA